MSNTETIKCLIPWTSKRDQYQDGLITHSEYALSLYADGILTGGQALELAVSLEKAAAATLLDLRKAKHPHPGIHR